MLFIFVIQTGCLGKQWTFAPEKNLWRIGRSGPHRKPFARTWAETPTRQAVKGRKRTLVKAAPWTVCWDHLGAELFSSTRFNWQLSITVYIVFDTNSKYLFNTCIVNIISIGKNAFSHLVPLNYLLVSSRWSNTCVVNWCTRLRITMKWLEHNDSWNTLFI